MSLLVKQLRKVGLRTKLSFHPAILLFVHDLETLWFVSVVCLTKCSLLHVGLRTKLCFVSTQIMFGLVSGMLQYSPLLVSWVKMMEQTWVTTRLKNKSNYQNLMKTKENVN